MLGHSKKLNYNKNLQNIIPKGYFKTIIAYSNLLINRRGYITFNYILNLVTLIAYTSRIKSFINLIQPTTFELRICRYGIMCNKCISPNQPKYNFSEKIRGKIEKLLIIMKHMSLSYFRCDIRLNLDDIKLFIQPKFTCSKLVHRVELNENLSQFFVFERMLSLVSTDSSYP